MKALGLSLRERGLDAARPPLPAFGSDAFGDLREEPTGWRLAIERAEDAGGGGARLERDQITDHVSSREVGARDRVSELIAGSKQRLREDRPRARRLRHRLSL